jgi:two-component system, OmpR family, KDP operon response regulator KdpE
MVIKKTLILAVDDEPPILRLLSATLRANDYAVITANNGAEAVAAQAEHHPDLILLDVMMPDMDGHEVLRTIRQSSSTPVIMLTARTSDNEKVQALLSGADDYVTKPFHPDELIARITAVLRRSDGPAPAAPVELRYGDLLIDLGKRFISRGDDEIRLSRTEWALLELLATNTGRVMLHGDLLSRIWGPEFRDEVYYLRTWISRLRRKLGVNSDELITTMPGIGYRMSEPDA